MLPEKYWSQLDALLKASLLVVRRMLSSRSETSTKFYKEIPSVIAKSLSSKYQRNPKCKSVRRLVLPISGDKGRVIKMKDGGLRIVPLFKKDVLPIIWNRPVVGHVRSVEIYKRNGRWFASFCINVDCADKTACQEAIGVDRNSVGNVAVLADPKNGHVRHLGFNPARTKACWNGRKKNLQRHHRLRLLSKIRKKVSRQTKHQNHIVSKQVVDYAQRHSRAIVLENLGGIHDKRSSVRSYSERNYWSFSQLAAFIQYKARLAGVPVVEVSAAYTSQTCSRCGHIHKPKGKAFECPSCGHKDHRDANAAFVIAKRGMECIAGLASHSARTCCGPIDGPLSGKGKTANV